MATGGAIWTVNERDAYLNTTEETYDNNLIDTRNYYEATATAKIEPNQHSPD